MRLGFPGLGSNARALGMGNAFNALSDDASASYFNPAGFGLIKKMELSGGLSFTNFDNNTTFFGTQTNDNNTNTIFKQNQFCTSLSNLSRKFGVWIILSQNKRSFRHI